MATNNHFFSTLREIYNKDIIDSYKLFATTNRKLTNMTMRKDFLIQCRKRNIFPAHINNICNNIYHLIDPDIPFKNRLQNITFNYKKQILNLEINITFHKIKKYTKSFSLHKNFIINNSDRIFSAVFFELQLSYKNNLISENERKYKRKLTELATRYTSTYNTSSNDVVNLTNKEIPSNVSCVLGYGPKFALQLNKLSTKHLFKLITDLESILNTLNDTNLKNNIRCELVNIISNFMNSPHQKLDSPQLHLRQCFTQAELFLKSNKDIIVLMADKGNKTVIMYQNDYNDKMQTLLNDRST